jgi:hypothetical protein
METVEDVIRAYIIAYIQDFGTDPPSLEFDYLVGPRPGNVGYTMSDDTFPDWPTFFFTKEIKKMTEQMRQRVRERQKIVT